MGRAGQGKAGLGCRLAASQARPVCKGVTLVFAHNNREGTTTTLRHDRDRAATLRARPRVRTAAARQPETPADRPDWTARSGAATGDQPVSAHGATDTMMVCAGQGVRARALRHQKGNGRGAPQTRLSATPQPEIAAESNKRHGTRRADQGQSDWPSFFFSLSLCLSLFLPIFLKAKGPTNHFPSQ